MPRITIHLKKEEEGIKEMIRFLSEGGCDDCESLELNPYLGRSESDICRILLKRSVVAEYERLCKIIDSMNKRGE